MSNDTKFIKLLFAGLAKKRLLISIQDESYEPTSAYTCTYFHIISYF